MTELSTRQDDRAGATTGVQITVSDAYHGTVDQRTVDQWELHQARLALSILKEALSGEAMVRLLTPYIEAADLRGREVAAASHGEWGPPVESVFEVKGLRMEDFFSWFQAHLSDEPAMLAGNPDHYEIRMPEAIITETIGGIPTRFKFQPEPVERPETFKPDPAFPLNPGGNHAALATLLDDVTPQALATGMQLRETDDGFAMKMTLHFPAAAPPEMLEDHSRHYAIEFSRWITMAYQAKQALSGPEPTK
jgi:hypothetical protein